MFERKLEALEFHSPLDFDYQGIIYYYYYLSILFYSFKNCVKLSCTEDDVIFRNFISWLENQKIRLYKIEERAKLDNVENETEWPMAFAKYLTDLQLTHLDASKDRAYIIEQLLSHAIRLDYSDNSKLSLLNSSYE